MRDVRLLTLLLPLLTAAPAWAERGGLSLLARVGLADSGVGAAGLGPAFGVEGQVGLTEQLALVALGGQSRHPVDAEAGGGTYVLTQAGGGAVVALDLAPVVPSVEAGVGAVWRSYAGQSAVGAWPFLGLALSARPVGHLEVALGVRYWMGTRSDGSGQSYTQVLLGVGFGR